LEPGSGAGLASGPVTAGAGTSSWCRRSPVPTRHFSPAQTVRHSVPKMEDCLRQKSCSFFVQGLNDLQIRHLS
uniref:Uncharacterized protein n=1 Tax=Gopherus agassizii TaxID=38772 RepID=A0A452GMJ5_9SAUR